MNELDFGFSEEIDDKKLKRMMFRIYVAERENTKTQSKNDKAMKELIMKIIEEEAKKCY